MKTKLAALLAVGVGCILLLLARGEVPAWLACLQVAVFCLGALAYGFSAFSPAAPEWLSSRPVVGVVMLYMGVAVMFCPANIVCSAFFIGIGTRLILAPDVIAVRVKGGGLARRKTETTVEVR